MHNSEEEREEEKPGTLCRAGVGVGEGEAAGSESALLQERNQNLQVGYSEEWDRLQP